MRSNIHPEYKKSIVHCACGNTFETKSTAGNITTEICSQCHPFYTGKQRTAIGENRVSKFIEKYKLSKKKN